MPACGGLQGKNKQEKNRQNLENYARDVAMKIL